ncbi:hypothetical protein N9955_00415 [bacterium]|nr:hypothetical protein [bacterium]
MKKLESYRKNGYTFEIVARKNGWAIGKGTHKEGFDHTNWEVFEIQSHNGIYMGENWVDAKEFPPSNNQWGAKGFTALNEEHAKEILEKHI